MLQFKLRNEWIWSFLSVCAFWYLRCKGAFHALFTHIIENACVCACLQEESKAEEQLVGQIRQCWRLLLTSALSGLKFTLISAESPACEPRPADRRLADQASALACLPPLGLELLHLLSFWSRSLSTYLGYISSPRSPLPQPPFLISASF